MTTLATMTGFGSTASFAENTVNTVPQLLDADVVFTSEASLVGGRLVMVGLLLFALHFQPSLGF